jgi:hypothetical protein
MKIKCTTCKVQKDEKEFSKDSRKPSGKKGACKACVRKQRAEKEGEKKTDMINFYNNIIG